MTRPAALGGAFDSGDADSDQGPTAGGMGRRRVLVHASGFKQSPYSDIKPAGESTKSVPRKLWHRSPGSSG
jgi:error-prone DNA polymerase